MNLPTCYHPALLPVDTLLAECQIRRTRRGGPGGQHRNRVETAIVITHLPSGVVAQASERRSQEENRKVAIGRLRLNLALAIRANEGNRPILPAEFRKYIRNEKLSIHVGNDDYPAILSCFLDALAERQGDVATVAKSAGITTSQLVKFLKGQPPAWELVNQWRMSAGNHALK